MILPYRHLLVALLLSASVSCTEKGAPVNRHEGDQRKQTQQTVTEVDVTGQPQPLSKDVNILAERVLNPKRIRDPRSTTLRYVQDEMLALNQLLIHSSPSERQTANFGKILKRFVMALQLECGEIKSSCLGLSYFRMASSSSEVVKMAALRPEFSANSARLLLFAVELKNRQPDNELLQLLLSRVPPQTPALRSLLDSTLLLSAQNIRDDAKLRDFLTAVKAWDLSDNQKWMLSSGAQGALWSMISRARFMYGNDGQLMPEFQRIAQRLQSQSDSLAAQQKQMISVGLFKPEAMGAQIITKFDELYFIVDSVFLQKISIQSAAELFLTSRRRPEDLTATVENYVRMRFALALQDSTLAAQKIFTGAVATDHLLGHALRESAQVKQVWGNLESRLGMVKGFASSALKQTPGGEKFEPALLGLFNSFGRSVNLVAVYPHTLLLFHMLSQKRFRIYVDGFGDIDTGDLMPLIFHGKIKPLLPYSAELAPLNHFEVIHAFDMAVRSQLFATVQIDVDVFMSDTLSRLNQNPVKFIEVTLDRIEQRFQESKLFREFRSACRELKTGVTVPRVLTLNGIRRSPLYGETMDTLFSGVSTKSARFDGQPGSITEVEMGLFYPDTEYSEALEKVRLDIQMFERVGNAMLTSYADYLKRFEGLGEKEILKRTAKTRAGLENMRRLKERAIRTAQTWYKEVGFCYYKVAQQDYDSFHKILKVEEQYLARVHRQLKRLRTPGISESEKQQIQESFKFNGLPSNFRGFDKVDKDGYLFSSIDFLLRTAGTIERIAPYITVSLGSKLDLDVDLVRSATYTHLPYVESEQEFVQSGLKAIFKANDPAVVWIGLSGGRIVTWTNYIKTLMTSYRLEQELHVTETVFTPQTILEAHEDILRLTVLTDDDRKLFRTLRLNKRFDVYYLNDILLTYSVNLDINKYVMQDLWSLFDLPASLANMEKLGFDYDLNHSGPEKPPESHIPKRFGYMELGRHYYNARSSWIRGNPIIPYNSALDRELDARVTLTVQTEIKSSKRFHQSTAAYIGEIHKRPKALFPLADIDMNSRVSNLLSDNIVPAHEADIQEFRQSTQGCFVKKCTDFK